jgi:DNA-binding response OmpR family regulator
MNLFGKKKKEDSKKKEALSAKEEPIPAANGGQHSVGKGKILVVDDDEVVVMALTLKLQASGYQVISATDGATAVSLVRHESPDLVILDVNFPPEVGMSWDGFKIMEWFRGRAGAGTVPVIIITGEDSPRNKGRAASVGAVAFFQKPINTEELLATIHEVLA